MSACASGPAGLGFLGARCCCSRIFSWTMCRRVLGSSPTSAHPVCVYKGTLLMAENHEAVGALFRAGKLMPAIEAANAAVRKSPADLGGRILLAELLLFTGNVERADVILDAAAQADPTSLIAVAEFRQLLRAEIARRQYSRDGRVPEFLGEPSEALKAALAAGVALRAGEIEEVARHTAEAEATRPRVPGVATRQDVTTQFDD